MHIIYYHVTFQDSKLNIATFTASSQVCMAAILLLLRVEIKNYTSGIAYIGRVFTPRFMKFICIRSSWETHIACNDTITRLSLLMKCKSMPKEQHIMN